MRFFIEGELEHNLNRVRRGDQRGWESLVELLGPIALNAARRTRVSSEDAEDAVQRTFISLYQNRDKIQNAQTLPRWVAVTASRNALNLIRTRKEAISMEATNLDQVVADTEASAEVIAVQAVEQDLVHQGLDRLDDRCNRLLRALFSSEDCDYRSLADDLKIPIGSIGPTRARCLDKLRRSLLKLGFFSENGVSAIGGLALDSD